MYYVVGGVWKTTKFEELVEGTLELYGPFDTLEEANAKWSGASYRKVDDAHHKLFVKRAVFHPQTSKPAVPVGRLYVEL